MLDMVALTMPDKQKVTIDQNTALVLADRTQSVDLYQTMCAAIAECVRVDQVQEIRNRAKALEEYTHQSKNFEAEAQLSAIRLRAERRAGELLLEMKENGERCDERGSNMKVLSGERPTLSTLSDLDISGNDSFKWQQLARMPAPDFEAALAVPGVKRTGRVIAEYRKKYPAMAKAVRQTKPADENRSDRQRRLVCEAAMKMADGRVHSVQRICDMTGHMGAEQFLRRAPMLPWLKIERLPDGYRFVVDEELRLICEDRMPRPQLNGAGIHAFIKRLAKEIDCKRKENHEKHKAAKWNPDNVSKIEQKRLLDWVERELLKLADLMASSGPDYSMSAIRTQNHPDKDEERIYVLQEKHSNRTVDPRPC